MDHERREPVIPTTKGSTQQLAAMVDGAADQITTIAQVAAKLADILNHTETTTTRGRDDGICCFTRLYHEITTTVDNTQYLDRDFLVRLDIEFARRYFDALAAYSADRRSTPGPWRVLFDLRSNPDIEPVQFAAAGVNAHINYDLAPALLATWAHFPPDPARRSDYEKVNDIFRRHMDGLRETFGAAWAEEGEDGGVLDLLANRIGSFLVKHYRDAAWEDAIEVWEAEDQPTAMARMMARLGEDATEKARLILQTPVLQWVS